MFNLTQPALRDLDRSSAMPDEFRRHARSAWADANKGGEAVHSFLEGPVFDAAGNLYVTDIPWGRVFRIDPAGAWTLVAEYDGEPNGMKLLDAGTLLVTDYKHGLMRLDIASGRVAPHLERRNSERFRGVNDLILDADGNVYFTDQGQSGLHDPSGPDGLAVDVDGRLLVANPGLGVVWVLDGLAEPVEVLRGPRGASLTNLAFGGPERRDVYVTDSSNGTILRATLSRAGVPLHRGRPVTR